MAFVVHLSASSTQESETDIKSASFTELFSWKIPTIFFRMCNKICFVFLNHNK